MKLFFIFLVWSFTVSAANKTTFKTFDNINLHAKLYFPPKIKIETNAILIIEGSGKSGFTEEPEGSPFNQLATDLAEKGNIVLKYNKRGSGENAENGSFWKSTFSIDNKDVQSALDFLKSQKNVNQSKLFLIGHSFGGPQALVLSQKNKIAGIVMLTSTVQPIEKLMHEQNKVIMNLTDVPTAEVTKELSNLDKKLSEIKNNTYKCVQPDCEIIDGVAVLDKSIQVPWLHEVLNLNFLSIAKEQKSNLLFIFGNSDFVIPLTDQSFVRDNLLSTSNNKVQIKVIEKLDHFMVENESKKESLSYAHKAQKEKSFKLISKELVTTIGDWILK